MDTVITNNTPLAVLTVGQFLDVVVSALAKAKLPATDKAAETEDTEVYTSDRYAYGISGIAELFGVSLATAQRYKDTFLAPAITQRGRHIMTDKKMAMELFDTRNNQ